MFFANVIDNWSVADDQSSSVKPSDLQVAKASGTATMSCPMAHQMGLAAMTLGTKSIPNIQYHNASGSLLSGNTDGNTVNVAAAGFTGTNLPFLSNTTYFAIINGSKTFTSSSPDGWTYSPIAAGGTIVTQTIYSKRTFKYKGWLYEYTGGIQSLSITQAGSYKLEVWGAQGGKASIFPTTFIAACKGGYSYGTKTMTNGNTLFICVGGVGGTATYGNTVTESGGAGGYNGGGAGGGYYGGHAYQGGNGQYTDVAGAGGSGYIGGVTGGSTSNGVREGHGYARITTNFEWVF